MSVPGVPIAWPLPYLSGRSQYQANLELGGSLVSLDDDLLRVSGVTWGQAGPCWPGGIRHPGIHRSVAVRPRQPQRDLQRDGRRALRHRLRGARADHVLNLFAGVQDQL